MFREKETDSIKQRAIRGGKAMVFGKIFNQAISFGVVWIQAHYLPVWAYGIFGLFLGTTNYINTLGNAGTGEVAKRFVPEFAEKGDIRSIARTVRGLVAIRLLVSAFVLAVIVLFFDKIGPLLKIGEYRTLFTFFAFGILFTLEARLMFSVYWGLLRQPFYMVVFTAFNIFRLVGFYLVLGNGGGLVGALAVDAASNLLFFIGLYLPFIFEFDPRAPKTHRIPIRRMVRYGAFMYSSNLGHIFFNTTTDLYIISAMLGKVELGLYAFAVTLGQAIMRWMPDKLVGSVIETVVYRDYTRKNSADALPEQFSKVVTMQAFFVLPTAIFLITFARPLIERVFDAKFLPAAGICGGLAVVFAVAAFKFPLNLVATSLEKTKLLFISQTVFAIYNLVADIILIPILGLWGAVIATGTAYIFMVAGIWIPLSRSVRLKIDGGALVRIIANSALMGLYFHLLSKGISSLLEFIAAFVGGGLLYLLLSIVNCPIDREMRRALFNALKKGNR